MQTLMIERYAAADEAGFGPKLSALIELAREASYAGRPANEDVRTRRQIANTFRQQSTLVAIRTKTFMALREADEPGPEGSIHKLVSMRLRQSIGTLAMDLMGPSGVTLDHDLFPQEDFAQSWLTAPTLRIARGADEMLLNTIAERILGLPQDYRPDKNVLFDQIKAAR